MRLPAIILTLLALTACTPQPPRNPTPATATPRTQNPEKLAALLISTSTPDDSRIAADRLLIQAAGTSAPARLDLLEQILYAPGHSDAMRIYALDQLAAANPNRAVNALDLYLPQLKGEDLAVVRHACDVAVKIADPRLLDPLIISLATSMDGRPQASPALLRRPENEAIAKLTSKTLTEALFEVTLHGSISNRRTSRIAALDILGARLLPDAILQKIKGVPEPPASDTWLSDTRWWLETFGTTPFTQNESNWITLLRKPEYAPLLARAIDRLKRLPPDADYHPSPRHIHALAYAPQATIDVLRETLTTSLQQRLGQLQHVVRTADYPGAPEDRPINLTTAFDRADLLAIDLLLTALAKPTTQAEILRLGTADMSDTTTEHGGLAAFLNVATPDLAFFPYPPLYTTNDFEYITGDRLLHATPTGIAQYHFHFQQLQNRDRAGPGPGDLEYARRQRVNCVVFTSIGPREFNADFYTPNGAVLDLGNYKVPNVP